MKNTNKIMKASFLTNLFLSIIKVIIGFFGKSSSLIADGIHSLSDLITDIVAIVGNSFASKPADHEHPYGHGKLEYLTCLFIGVIVLSIGLGLIGNASKTNIVKPSIIVIVCSLFTIVVKYLLSTYLIKKGRLYKNSILLSSGKESRADVLSSVVVLISGILMQYSDKILIFKYSDIVATIIVGIFIVKTGFIILKDNMSMLLGERETDTEILDSMYNCIMNYKEIKQIDEFLVMKNGPYYTVTSQVSMNGRYSLKKAHSIIDNIEKDLKEKYDKIKYINIHINPY